METGWRNSFCGVNGGTGADGDDGGGQNGNFPSNVWDIWDISTPVAPPVGTCYDWTNHDTSNINPAATARVPDPSVVHALLFGSNPIHNRMLDPHIMCLKLGKRHYCEDAVVSDTHMTAESLSAAKRGKPPYPYYVNDNTTTVWPASQGVKVTYSPAAVVPRCQVEGCHVALSNAKDYYKRHKVCEIHSKAPKVVVLGLQQRFCQQCSRFHGISEFDETKRSCRRRLEGHNQRRRKGSLSNSLSRNFPSSHENNLTTEPGCALSLLSSPKTESWISSGDLSSRCSAALSELIAVNRATSSVVVGNLMDQNGSDQNGIDNSIDNLPNRRMWDRSSDNDDDDDQTAMTLDLMQAPVLDLGILSMKEKSRVPEEWTDFCGSTF